MTESLSLNRPRTSIRRQLLINNFAVTALLLSAAAILIWQVTRLASAISDFESASARANVALEIQLNSSQLAITINRLLSVEEAELFETDVSASIIALRTSNEQLQELVKATPETESTNQLASVVSKAVDDVIGIAETMIRQASAGQWGSVQVRLGILSQNQQMLANLIEELVTTTTTAAEAASVRKSSALQATILYPAAVITIAVASGILLAVRTTRNFIQPIAQLMEAVERVAAGRTIGERIAVGHFDELDQLALAFNHMADRVEAAREELEQRVQARTRAVETTAKVSRRLSTILKQDELVREVVEQIQQAFHYYHTHIYLWDKKRENLLMAGGTGEAGRAMLASGHSIPAEKGLVGRAAETGTVVLVPDVSQTIGWLPNPLLPDTKAEIAVPILLGDTVLGVLDVQHNIVGGLDQNDADLLLAIANQVAIALQNAQTYSTAQSQAEKEAQRNEIVQKIQSTTSIEDALKVAVRELGRATLAPQTIVRLRQETGENGQKTAAN